MSTKPDWSMDEGVTVRVYDEKTNKFRVQRLKRRKLVGKKIVCTSKSGERVVGKIEGFREDNGDMVITVASPEFAPDPKGEFTVVW